MLPVILGVVGFGFVAYWLTRREVRPAPRQPEPERKYTCCECGAGVVTPYQLDGLCSNCWDNRFEAASERLAKEHE